MSTSAGPCAIVGLLQPLNLLVGNIRLLLGVSHICGSAELRARARPMALRRGILRAVSQLQQHCAYGYDKGTLHIDQEQS